MPKMNLVVGFSGAIGSGKTTLSRGLAEILQCPLASFGDYIRKQARLDHQPATREVLQEVGEKLLKEGVESLCPGVLEEAGWTKGHLIIDGIRHTEVLSTLRQMVAPLPLVLVHINIRESERRFRLEGRGVSFKHIEELDNHPTEKQVSKSLKDAADLVVDGSKGVGILTSEIHEWLIQHYTKSMS